MEKKTVNKKRLLVFNWKMNPSTSAEAREIFALVVTHTKNPLIVIPPFLYINELARVRSKKIALGAQDVWKEERGSFTGEIGPLMLKNMGVAYAIVGHSERRYIQNEGDELVAKKVFSSLNNKIIPILCVGEKTKMSVSKAWNFVKKQLDQDLSLIKNIKLKNKDLIIAYEPVWAIGGNKTTDASHSASLIVLIKDHLKNRYKLSIKVLYGGSVSCNNIESFTSYKEIDGFLVGSAGLDKSQLQCIINKIN
ncbi:MAG TPA: triose-phosphate isomerase [Candidatus Paceibacterota bacterium]|nr:triose-phosphate isomerase [Candidatus Paceibacterota bacterium]